MHRHHCHLRGALLDCWCFVESAGCWWKQGVGAPLLLLIVLAVPETAGE
jgi:hypothetical protein